MKKYLFLSLSLSLSLCLLPALLSAQMVLPASEFPNAFITDPPISVLGFDFAENKIAVMNKVDRENTDVNLFENADNELMYKGFNLNGIQISLGMFLFSEDRLMQILLTMEYSPSLAERIRSDLKKKYGNPVVSSNNNSVWYFVDKDSRAVVFQIRLSRSEYLHLDYRFQDATLMNKLTSGKIDATKF